MKEKPLIIADAIQIEETLFLPFQEVLSHPVVVVNKVILIVINDSLCSVCILRKQYELLPFKQRRNILAQSVLN